MRTPEATPGAGRRWVAWIEILLCLLPVNALWLIGTPFMAVTGGQALEQAVWPAAHVSEFQETDPDDPQAAPMRKPARVLAAEIRRTRESGTRRLCLLGLLAGGVAGWPALWSLVLPAALGRDVPARIGPWRVVGLLLGIAACAWYLASMRHGSRIQGVESLLWPYIAGSPMLVALHQLASIAARRRAVRAHANRAA